MVTASIFGLLIQHLLERELGLAITIGPAELIVGSIKLLLRRHAKY
jgi:hypothetical protein